MLNAAVALSKADDAADVRRGTTARLYAPVIQCHLISNADWHEVHVLISVLYW